MRKMRFLSVIIPAVLAFAACSKKDSGCAYTDYNIKAPDSEVQQVEMYLAANNVTAQKDSSGLYYLVENAGTGKTPGLCSVVSVFYTGSLTNDQVFDQSTTTPASFRLGELILGWQKGLPHIKGGGKIKLYIPPSLGYGAKDVKDEMGNIVIPASSVLVFSLELTDVK